MGRIRTIKPDFPQSESMGNVSREARLLFLLLLTLADDSGRTRGSSRLLASLLYPYDDDAGSLIPAWLTELQRQGCIDLYSVDGAAYLQIHNWLKHQKIDKPTASKIPAFDESSRILAEPSRILPVGSGSGSGSGSGMEGDMDKEGEAILSANRKMPKAANLDLPPNLPPAAWESWLEYRRERKLTCSPIAMRRHLNLLAGISDPQAAIQQSITQGYTGLFEPKQLGATQNANIRTAEQSRSNFARLVREQAARHDNPVVDGTAERLFD